MSDIELVWYCMLGVVALLIFIALVCWGIVSSRPKKKREVFKYGSRVEIVGDAFYEGLKGTVRREGGDGFSVQMDDSKIGKLCVPRWNLKKVEK